MFNSCQDNIDVLPNNPSIENRQIASFNCTTSINFDYLHTTNYKVLSETHQDLCDEDLALLQTETKTKRVSMCSNATNYCMEIQSLSSSKSNESYNRTPYSETTTICNGVVTNTNPMVEESIFNDLEIQSIFQSFQYTENQSLVIMDSLVQMASANGTLISSPGSDIVGITSVLPNSTDILTLFIDQTNRTQLGYTISDQNGKINTKVEMNYSCDDGKFKINSVVIKRCLISPICKMPVMKTTKIMLNNLQTTF